jgi:hypothetical protein
LTSARDATATITLADRFRAARATRIDVDGRQVHSVYAIPVAGSSLLNVRRRHVTAERPQSLRLGAAVDLVANGHRSRDLVLRSATLPSRADITVEADDPTIVYVWNTWTIEHTEHAWLGNAGMLVEYDLTGVNPTVRLRCSDGVGPADFDDLRLDIEIAPRSVALAEPNAGRRPVSRNVPAG